LIRKMPKRGFSNISRKEYQIVNLDGISKIKDAAIDPQVLKSKGLIKDETKLVKILGEGVIKNPVTIKAHAFSKKAAEEIRKAGGTAQIINA